MSLSFGNYVNCLLMIGLSNNLTIVTQGGTPVKPTFYVLWWEKSILFTIEYSNIIGIPIRIFEYRFRYLLTSLVQMMTID